MENERKGRIKSDKLSEEERNVILKWGAEKARKGVEIYYWFGIASLVAQGYTPEQAREKIYQDLLEKGDLEGAKRIRRFQDKVHPLKKDDPEMPPSSPQPSPTSQPPT